MKKAINEPNPTIKPFQNIALTISGGGFRAAAFGLGALSYLDSTKWPVNDNSGLHQNLLKNVTYISSTSGGSFTNALYSTFLHQGKSFEEVYRKLLNDISGEKILQEVFKVLNNDAEWVDSAASAPPATKHKNIINAFAKAYNNIIYNNETFSIFWDKSKVKDFEVCFNSTEFYRGLSFRFQADGFNFPLEVIGNKYLRFNMSNVDALKKVRLADMVAASSCFPVGFEPIMYPEDFTYNDSVGTLTATDLSAAMVALDYNEVPHTPIASSYGFMDGGITDNQALYSVMLADIKRRKRVNPNPFDLIMISDVASYFMEEFKNPEEIKSGQGVRSKIIKFYFNKVSSYASKLTTGLNRILLVGVVMLLTGCGLVIFANPAPAKYGGYAAVGASVILIALSLLIKSNSAVKWVNKSKTSFDDDTLIQNLAKKQTFLSEAIFIKLLTFLEKLKISSLEQIIKARLLSIGSMLLDVNLKQTRRLIFEMFYDDARWENRRISNYIYELSTYNITVRKKRLSRPDKIGWHLTPEDIELLTGNCEKLHPIAEDARTMPTTLWFSSDVKDEEMKKIITTGQFTTCCNLLQYVISLQRSKLVFDDATKDKLRNLKQLLTNDFLKFKEDPYFLYDASA